MAQDRIAVRTPALERRPAVALVQRSAAPAARSPAQALQQRLGNQATLALLERSSAAPLANESAAAVRIQRAAAVSSPSDPAELEAQDTATKLMRMPAPVSAAPAPAPSPPAPSGAGPGAPLPPSVRAFMEPRFGGADFSAVRVHAGEAAAQQSEALQAHAFTVGRDVYFARNKFQPDTAAGKELIAHELTHTIQQGAVVQAGPVRRSVDTTVSQRTTLKIQRLGIGDALDYIADKANYIPGFRLLTLVLGTNPINLAPVERSGANVLRALLELIPVTGPLLLQALETHGIVARAGAWIDTQVRNLGLAGSALKRALDAFLDSLSWRDIFRLDDVWERAKRIFTEPIGRLVEFGKSLAGDILRFIREAILLPLARLAEGTRGYDLLKAVLGQDPITGQPVARTPDALIGGFMKLIGREEIWENVKKANAIPRAIAWFEGALAALQGFVRQIPTLIVNALRSLELADLIVVPKAFIKVAGVFAGFVGQFVNWAGNAAYALLELIFEVVAPKAMPYLKKVGAAFRRILDNPIGFVGNLVAAAKLGFQTFADHFFQHLKTSLFEWLTGALPGVYIPQSFELKEIVKFVLSVLGLTWQNIRAKLVKVLGETAVKALETGFDIVVTLVREGPAAAWDKIKEQLGNLKEMVIDGIIGFVTDTIVKKAVAKIASLLVPGGAFISAIVSIYDTIMVLIDQLQRMIQVATAFLDSMIEIVEGKLAGAAKKVETTLAGLLTLAISVLAGFLGLGKIADKVMEFLNTKVRAPIDKALDALIDWIVKAAKSLFAKVTGKKDERTPEQKAADLDKAMLEAEALLAKPNAQEAEIKKQLPAIKIRYNMASLYLVVDSEDASTETIHFEGGMSPSKSSKQGKISKALGNSPSDPIEFTWVKPAVASYPRIDLTIAGKNVKPGPLDSTTVGPLKIGVTYGDALAIKDGAVIQAKTPVTSNTVKDNMNDVLKAHGYDREKGQEAPRDTDHVVEKQLGGPDDVSNLWPLNASTNRSSGGTVRAEIERITKANKWSTLVGKWLKLKF